MESTFEKTMMESIHSCHKSFADYKEPDELYDNLLKHLLKISESQYGFIAEWITFTDNNIAPYFHNLVITNISWDEPSRKLYSRIKTHNLDFTNMNSLFGICGITEKLIISNNPYTDTRRGGKPIFPHGHPILYSFAGIPMFFRNKFIGMMGIANKKNGYTKEFIEKINPIIYVISHIVGSYINELKILELNNQVFTDLEVLKQTKNSFSAKVTHDIRTPIGAIIGITNLLKINTALDEQQKQYIDMIDSCSTQLLSLINDLLDFSKCKSGNMKIRNNTVNLKECLEEVCDINFVKANEKNLNILYMIDSDAPLYIISDNEKIKQILVNLISNAIKFTKTGTILTYIQSDSPDAYNKINIMFSVYDTGVGMHKKYLNDIFDPFKQIEDNDLNRVSKGTGLGLSICKDLVELLGGSINVYSEINKGSKFYFNILAQCINSNKENNYLKNKHVIIVDDETINRMLYNNIFTEMGMKTHMFSDGTKALKYIKNHPKLIDISLINIHMPNMDGIELAQNIKKINANIMLISVSADTGLEWMEWMEIQDIFNKNIYIPINRAKLQKTCNYFLMDATRSKSKKHSDKYITSPKNCNIKKVFGF